MSLTRRAGLLSALTALGAGLTGCSAPAVVTTQEGGGPTGATASSDATGNALTAADPLPTGAVNAIVCGTDSDRDNTNTDVLVLAQLSADRRQVTLVSVPRDCYVPIAGGPPRKVNAALAEQGVAALSRTVSDLFGGLTVHYVAQTNFADFVKLCAAFDGFSVTNRLASSVTSSVTGKVTTFPAGPLQLHGADWLIYARQRHGLPNGDFDRGERHRARARGRPARHRSRTPRLPPRPHLRRRPGRGVQRRPQRRRRPVGRTGRRAARRRRGGLRARARGRLTGYTSAPPASKSSSQRLRSSPPA